MPLYAKYDACPDAREVCVLACCLGGGRQWPHRVGLRVINDGPPTLLVVVSPPAVIFVAAELDVTFRLHNAPHRRSFAFRTCTLHQSTRVLIQVVPPALFPATLITTESRGRGLGPDLGCLHNEEIFASGR